MNNIFVIASLISVVFFVVKFIEMRFVEKENKPLKTLVKNTLLVYFSVLIANFVADQINPLMNGGATGPKVTPVFTDNPGF